MYKAILERFSVLSRRQKILAVGLPLYAAVWLYDPSSSSGQRQEISLALPENQIVQDVLEQHQKPESASEIPNFEYEIKKGDSLSQIFDQLGLGYSSLMKIMEADLSVLALDTLKPGDELSFWQDESGSLNKMVIHLSLVEKVEYTLNSDDSYTVNSIKIPGQWQSYTRVGEINGSFSQSVNREGISSTEIEQIVNLFKDKLNFSRDIRAGDKFEIVQSKQFVGKQATGNTELQAIRILTRGQVVSAYLHTDGQYYDKNGQSLQKAFQRYPTVKRFRISSSFNPNRRHPVTGRISPHNGTDFATPVGTPVVSIGDGRVAAVRKHPYAGNYVVIKHDNTYSTRYLHLSRILVSKGQKVFKGQKIGLSGKSGRVTGPHLHFELLVRGRAVNAMKADIPMATSIPPKEMSAFIARRNELDQMMHKQELKISSNRVDIKNKQS